MSSGAFVRARYQAVYSSTAVHPIKVQPETLTASASTSSGSVTNEGLTAPATNPISAQVSRSTRALGLHAALVTLKVTGTPPTGYAVGSTVRLPAVNQAFFNACRAPGTVVTYLGATWAVVGTRAEQVK